MHITIAYFSEQSCDICFIIQYKLLWLLTSVSFLSWFWKSDWLNEKLRFWPIERENKTWVTWRYMKMIWQSLASPANGHWGTSPSTYNNYIFQRTLTCTKSDSDYMSTVASCKNPVTFACASPGTKSWRHHWWQCFIMKSVCCSYVSHQFSLQHKQVYGVMLWAIRLS